MGRGGNGGHLQALCPVSVLASQGEEVVHPLQTRHVSACTRHGRLIFDHSSLALSF